MGVSLVFLSGILNSLSSTSRSFIIDCSPMSGLFPSRAHSADPGMMDTEIYVYAYNTTDHKKF